MSLLLANFHKVINNVMYGSINKQLKNHVYNMIPESLGLNGPGIG